MSREEVEVTNEASEDAVIEAAMKAESARNMGVELPEEVKQPSQAEQAEQAAEEVKQEKEKPAEPTLEERITALAEENKRLRKDIDTTNGRYGSHLQNLRSQLDEIKGRPSSNPFSGLSFDELKEDYPEMGERLEKIFKAQQEQKQQQQQEQPAQEKETQEQRPANHDQFQRELAIERLAEKHPDYESFAKFTLRQLASGVQTIQWHDPQFGAFVETLDDDDRDVIINGDSPSEILRMSRIFSQYEGKQQSSEESSEVTEQPPKKEKIKPDLTKSILPSGRVQSGKMHMTEDEIIEAAKKAEMRRQMVGY